LIWINASKLRLLFRESVAKHEEDRRL
jgi:thiosulfate dehydrogenase (quinone) large subunit